MKPLQPSPVTVIQTPLQQLWNVEGILPHQRVMNVGRDRVAVLISTAEALFVIADVGKPLEWIEPKNKFRLWKKEIKPHLVNHGGRFNLDDFPDGYAYVASEWRSGSSSTIAVLLEKHH